VNDVRKAFPVRATGMKACRYCHRMSPCHPIWRVSLCICVSKVLLRLSAVSLLRFGVHIWLKKLRDFRTKISDILDSGLQTRLDAVRSVVDAAVQ